MEEYLAAGVRRLAEFQRVRPVATASASSQQHRSMA